MATLLIHLFFCSGVCNGTTTGQGGHKLLHAPVNMKEMAQNLGKTSDSTKEVKNYLRWMDIPIYKVAVGSIYME